MSGSTPTHILLNPDSDQPLIVPAKPNSASTIFPWYVAQDQLSVTFAFCVCDFSSFLLPFPSLHSPAGYYPSRDNRFAIIFFCSSSSSFSVSLFFLLSLTASYGNVWVNVWTLVSCGWPHSGCGGWLPAFGVNNIYHKPCFVDRSFSRKLKFWKHDGYGQERAIIAGHGCCLLCERTSRIRRCGLST
jgi:hypothetical protein